MQVNEYKTAVKKTIMLAFKKFPHTRDISFHLHPLTAVALAHSDNPYVLRSLRRLVSKVMEMPRQGVFVAYATTKYRIHLRFDQE
jgi:hypothetical protein